MARTFGIGRRTMLFAAALTFAAGPASAEGCEPIEQTVAEVVQTEPRARADVTERFRCYFPIGLGFNDAAERLEAHDFDRLNRVEPLFHLWSPWADEFASRRFVTGASARVEIRIVVQTTNKRISKFAAQYFSTPL